MPGEAPKNTLRLRYTFNSEIEKDGTLLAMENPEVAKITFNGESIENDVVSWYVDKSLKTVKLKTVRKGENVLLLEIPYGEKTAAECVYILGEFGVRVEGTHCTVTELPEKLCFGNITAQGFPFYSGKLTYSFETETEAGTLDIRVPQFRASTLRVHCNGESKPVALSPYKASFDVEKGIQKISIDAYIPRTNGFGPLHCADEKYPFQGPAAWRTVGDRWCYEYKLLPEGVITSPVIICNH